VRLSEPDYVRFMKEPYVLYELYVGIYERV